MLSESDKVNVMMPPRSPHKRFLQCRKGYTNPSIAQIDQNVKSCAILYVVGTSSLRVALVFLYISYHPFLFHLFSRPHI